MQPDTPPKLIKLQMGNLPNQKLWQVLKQHLPEAIAALQNEGINIVYIEKKNN